MPRKRRRPLSRSISSGYKALSWLNTLSWILTGNLPAILRHLMRKKVVRRAGRLF